MTPFFSVIVPVYNVEAWLRAGVDSVLAQDDRDFEILLVDDGAQDASPQICDAYAAAHDFVRVIHKPNGGLFSARNAGLEAARGVYVLMPDSDDWIEPNTLSSVRRAIAQAAEQGVPQVDIVHFDMMRHDQNGTRSMRSTVATGLYAQEKVAQLRDAALLTSDGYLLSACICAYRREFLQASGLRFVSEREVLSEDFLFNLCALMTVRSVWVMNQPLYHYESREGSLTHRAKPRMAERYTQLYRELVAYAAAHATGEKLESKLAAFYVMKLICRNVIHAEYMGWSGSSWERARENVRRVLQSDEVRQAARCMDISHLDAKDRVRALCIRFGLEWPLAFSYRKQNRR